jgi:Fe-S-cluster containining protein
MNSFPRFLFIAIVTKVSKLETTALISISKTKLNRQKLCNQYLPSSLNASPMDDDSAAYELALQKTKLPEDTWWTSLSSFPFSCTSCGKCCKTKGSVWLSPDEISKTSKYLNLDMDTFIANYAHRTLSENELVWMQLKNDPEDEACIFLEDTKCKIYEVRPVQCSTYPFWPNILESEYSWDKEVRQSDDDISGPYWNAVDGGCEGMNYISGVGNNDGVPIELAHAMLEAYKCDERRFPKTT